MLVHLEELKIYLNGDDEMGKRLKMLQEQLTFLQSHNATKEEIEDIEAKIARSKKATRSKAKGGDYERVTAKRFMKYLPELDLVKTPSSGGFQHSSNNEDIRGDISNLNKDVVFQLHIECKNQKVIKMKDWLSQASSDCPSGKIPTVVFHLQQEIEEGKVTQKADDFICLRVEDFLKIVDKEEIVKRK